MLQQKLKEIREKRERVLQARVEMITEFGWTELADMVCTSADDIFFSYAVVESVWYVEKCLDGATIKEEEQRTAFARDLLTKLLIGKFAAPMESSSAISNFKWDMRRKAIAYVLEQIADL